MADLTCGTDCMWPDRPHLEPIVDWIGDWPILHGERDNLDPEHNEYCLCGHPEYGTCPAPDGGVLNMTICREVDGEGE